MNATNPPRLEYARAATQAEVAHAMKCRTIARIMAQAADQAESARQDAVSATQRQVAMPEHSQFK